MACSSLQAWIWPVSYVPLTWGSLSLSHCNVSWNNDWSQPNVLFLWQPSYILYSSLPLAVYRFSIELIEISRQACRAEKVLGYPKTYEHSLDLCLVSIYVCGKPYNCLWWSFFKASYNLKFWIHNYTCSWNVSVTDWLQDFDLCCKFFADGKVYQMLVLWIELITNCEKQTPACCFFLRYSCSTFKGINLSPETLIKGRSVNFLLNLLLYLWFGACYL